MSFRFKKRLLPRGEKPVKQIGPGIGVRWFPPRNSIKKIKFIGAGTVQKSMCYPENKNDIVSRTVIRLFYGINHTVFARSLIVPETITITITVEKNVKKNKTSTGNTANLHRGKSPRFSSSYFYHRRASPFSEQSERLISSPRIRRTVNVRERSLFFVTRRRRGDRFRFAAKTKRAKI